MDNGMKIKEFTLLTSEQVSTLDVFQECGTIKAFPSDVATLTGANAISLSYGDYCLQTRFNNENVFVVSYYGDICHYSIDTPNISYRPVFKYNLRLSLFPKTFEKNKEANVILYGYYPQNIVSWEMQNILNQEYRANNLKKTGNIFHLSASSIPYGSPFDDMSFMNKYEEYFYNGKRYVRIKANTSSPTGSKFKLSTGEFYYADAYYWVEVLPIRWLVDMRTGYCVSERLLYSGVPFNIGKYEGNFKKTMAYESLRLFAEDINNYKLENEMVFNNNARYHDETVEVKQVLDKIYDIIDTMPVDTRELIVKKIELLIQEYKNKRNIRNRSSLNLTQNREINLTLDSKISKGNTELIIQLEDILAVLSKNNEYAEIINKMDDYNKLLDTDIKELPKECNSIDSFIMAIVYYAKKMNNENREKIINDLRVIMGKPNEVFKVFLNNQVTDETGLTLEYRKNPKKSLMDELDSYLDKVRKFYSDNKNSLELMRVLEDNQVIKTEKIDTIDEIIINTRYAINNITDSVIREELDNKFNTVCVDYFNMLRRSVISNKSRDEYNEIVMSLHKELEPILKDLDNEIGKEKVFNDLMEELKECLSMVMNGKILDEDKDTGILISFMNDILRVVNDNNLDEEGKQELREQIINFVKNEMNMLEVMQNGDSKEMVKDSLEKKVWRDFAGLCMDVTMAVYRYLNEKIDDDKQEELTAFLDDYQEYRGSKYKR